MSPSHFIGSDPTSQFSQNSLSLHLYSCKSYSLCTLLLSEVSQFGQRTTWSLCAILQNTFQIKTELTHTHTPKIAAWGYLLINSNPVSVAKIPIIWQLLNNHSILAIFCIPWILCILWVLFSEWTLKIFLVGKITSLPISISVYSNFSSIFWSQSMYLSMFFMYMLLENHSPTLLCWCKTGNATPWSGILKIIKDQNKI